ncbi:MAG: hypothetical protein CL676_00990 [Bdellovibrionaceae bacterium]|nr:hypothetical protein [Pseudobdellovibrionaceae bacterium]
MRAPLFNSLLIILGILGAQTSFAEILTERVFDSTLLASQKGESKILPTYNYSESKISITDRSLPISSFGSSIQDYGISYLYGVSESLTLGTSLFWRRVNESQYDKDGSLINPEFFLRAKKALQSDVVLFYGATLALSPSSSNATNNQFSGGHSLNGHFGVHKNLSGPHTVVGYTSFKFNGEREYKDGDFTSKNKGRHEIQVHGGYEFSFANFHAGATLGGMKLLKGTYESSSGGNWETQESDFFYGNLYGTVILDPQISIIPSFKYLQLLDGPSYYDYEIYSASLSVGVVF